MFFSYMTWCLYEMFLCLLQIYMHNRQDITETNLKPALLEGRDNSDWPVRTCGYNYPLVLVLFIPKQIIK